MEGDEKLSSHLMKLEGVMIVSLYPRLHGKDLAGQLRKVDPNESGSLEHFSFVMCYVELFEGPDGNTLEE